MNPEDIGRILDEIGERIGPAGEYAWEVAVTGHRIGGFITIGAGVAVLGIAAAGLWLWRDGRRKSLATTSSYGRDGEDAMVFGGGLALLASLAAIILFTVGIFAVAMPEYHVIQSILGAGR